MPVQIPMKPVAFNSMSVTLDNEQFILETIWSDRGNAWSLSIFTVDEVPIVSGIKMIESRVLNLEYNQSNAPKGYLITAHASRGRPVFEDLGVALKLYYYTEAEINAFTV
jgi:hypothetical protein